MRATVNLVLFFVANDVEKIDYFNMISYIFLQIAYIAGILIYIHAHCIHLLMLLISYFTTYNFAW